MASFALRALRSELFAPLFDLDDVALGARNMERLLVEGAHSHPCRVSLADAAIGEQVLLLSHTHQPANSPYHASGPIFVRRGVAQAVCMPDTLPDALLRRLMSLRAYDAGDRIIAAEVRDGPEVAAWLHRTLDDANVAYVHVHFARYGCYFCRADRA